MDAVKFLPARNLEPWLAELAGRAALLVPRQQGDAVVFAPYDPAHPPVLTRDATSPPKAAVFPACEELLRYATVKDPDNPGKDRVELTVPDPARPTLVFGSRPCGVRGFGVYDAVFDTDAVRDPYYAARRRATLFVSMACARPGNACFCNWVGSGPADPSGSDVLLTPVEDGYVAQAVTPAGEALLASALFQDAGEHAATAREVQAQALAAMDEAPDISGAPQALLDAFDDMEFWGAMSAKCLSCGACTYLCPTCYCFSITDEAKGGQGARLRSWDNCMSFQFTLEASGHNPRPTKAHRLKNRVGHKFSYHPGNHGGQIACCGCGRCIKSCPVGVDIREIVLAAIARAAKA